MKDCLPQKELDQLTGSFDTLEEYINYGVMNLNLWKVRAYTLLEDNTYVYVVSSTRITSEPVTITSPMEIIVNEGYLFRLIAMTTEGEFKTSYDWANYRKLQPGVAANILLSVKREDEGKITVGELLNAITITPKKDNNFYLNLLYDNVVYVNGMTEDIEATLDEIDPFNSFDFVGAM